MRTTRALIAFITASALCLSLILAGCKQKAVQRASSEQQVDQQLAEHVKAAFWNSPSFKFPDVLVASFEGKVQLSGFVRSEDQKSAAQAIAKEIPGVVEVENNISVKQ